MIDIALENIHKFYGAHHVLKGLSLEIHSGETVGIVGGNGTGKTTLFKVIGGEEPHDAGQIHLRKGLSIGYLPQIPEFPAEYTALDVLHQAFAKHFALQQELSKLEEQMNGHNAEQLTKIMNEYGRLQQEFELMGGYEIEARIGQVRKGLQITNEQLDQEFATLSGGEKSTVLLARVLLEEPDLLLLDEPSNHLDFQALEWLEDYVSGGKQTIVVISHDRYFLDRAVSRIIEVDQGKCRSFVGNYSAYLEQKEALLQQELVAFTNQEKKIKSMETTIRTLKEWGVRADNPKFHKRAASMQKRLDKMERIERPNLQPDKVQFGFGGGGRSGNDVINGTGLVKQYGPLIILDQADLHVRFGERLAVVGRNGAGKSTLLKLILGEALLDAGELQLGSNAKVGYLEQEVTFPYVKHNLIASLRQVRPMTEGQARQILAKFHFFGEDVFKKVSMLSGGEKSRLRLCHLVNSDVNVLILDEPTNHLDIPAIESLEEALCEFTGTLVFVSHDRYFINAIADRVVELENGRINSYSGNYDYYRTKKNEQHQVEPSKPMRPKTVKPAPRRQSTNNAKELVELEEKIAGFEEELSVLNVQISKAGADYELLQELYKQQQSIKQEYDRVLEAWVELAPDES